MVPLLARTSNSAVVAGVTVVRNVQWVIMASTVRRTYVACKLTFRFHALAYSSIMFRIYVFCWLYIQRLQSNKTLQIAVIQRTPHAQCSARVRVGKKREAIQETKRKCAKNIAFEVVGLSQSIQKELDYLFV